MMRINNHQWHWHGIAQQTNQRVIMSVEAVESKCRTVGGTECSWCRGVRGGTGIAVLALLTSKPPLISNLQTALRKLQNSHPILRSRIHHSTTEATTFSFVTSPTSSITIESHDGAKILAGNENDDGVSPFHRIMEHELNRNTWRDPSADMFVASVYAMPDATASVVVLRLHVAACDRTTAASLLRELLVVMEAEEEVVREGEVSLAIEDLVPGGKAKKPMWARGLDVLSYSVNSLRLTNLKFHDTKTDRFSQVVRLQLNHTDTKRVMAVSSISNIY